MTLQLEPKPWTPRAYKMEDGWHVEAVGSGFWQQSDAWSFNPAGRVTPWRALCYLPRYLSGRQLRREYPKNMKGLAKSLAECQRWCDWRNARDAAEAKALEAAKETFGAEVFA